jgi:hypothetical protein
VQLRDRPSNVSLLAARPCAPDAAPPRNPTRAGRKRRDSKLLGSRVAVGVGERAAAAAV